MNPASVAKQPLKDKFFDYLYYVLAIIMAIRVISSFFLYPNKFLSFNDLLFNYAGGFIRRGLSGEIIFFANEYLNISPITFCYTVSLISFFFISFFLYRNFKAKRYNPFILLSGFMLGSIACYDLDFMRRDYMELALFLSIVILYKRSSTKVWLATGNIIAIIAILLHEATFFFTIPILVLITNINIKNIIKSTACWLPSIAAFCICCVYKGNAEMTTPIINAVSSHFPYLIEEQIPWPFVYVDADSIDVMKTHLGINFLHVLHTVPIPAFIITFLIWIMIFYLSIGFPTCFSKTVFGKSAQNSLANIIFFQFIALLPMFTILSCDISRVSVYWIISSFIVFFIIPESQTGSMFKPFWVKTTSHITARMLTIAPPSKTILTFLFLFIGIPAIHRTFSEIFQHSPFYISLDTVQSLFNHLISLLS